MSSNIETTMQITEMPNVVKGMVIIALGEAYGKGKNKLSEHGGYMKFAKIGLKEFQESPEKWGSFYRGWYNYTRRNIVISRSFWSELSEYAKISPMFRLSDVFVMCVLIGLQQEHVYLTEIIESLLLSNENQEAYRISRISKKVLKSN